jgi:predicted ABC-type ATPase
VDQEEDRPFSATASSRKLILLRGNSGSGKTTVAKRVRESSQRKIAVVEQDHIRRTLLKEKDMTGYANVAALIQQIVNFAMDREYDVIVEGILSFEQLWAMAKGSG